MMKETGSVSELDLETISTSVKVNTTPRLLSFPYISQPIKVPSLTASPPPGPSVSPSSECGEVDGRAAGYLTDRVRLHQS